jgi:hypothetical protein
VLNKSGPKTSQIDVNDRVFLLRVMLMAEGFYILRKYDVIGRHFHIDVYGQLFLT